MNPTRPYEYGRILHKMMEDDPSLTIELIADKFKQKADWVAQIGEIIGEEAYLADDGSRSTSVLCCKLPELVRKLKSVPSLMNTKMEIKTYNPETKETTFVKEVRVTYGECRELSSLLYEEAPNRMTNMLVFKLGDKVEGTLDIIEN